MEAHSTGRTLCDVTGMSLKNEAKNKRIAAVREQLEHRAFWMYLLCDEAGKRGRGNRHTPLQGAMACAGFPLSAEVKNNERIYERRPIC